MYIPHCFTISRKSGIFYGSSPGVVRGKTWVVPGSGVAFADKGIRMFVQPLLVNLKLLMFFVQFDTLP